MADDQLTLDIEPALTFVVIAPDGAVIARVPVDDGNWHAAECWAYLANLDDRKSRPEVYADA